MTTEVASGAVVYQVRDGKPYYLLLKSATSDFWGFPKGHVEAGENLADTALREIKEETQLTVELDTTYHDELQYDMNNGNHKEVHLFVSEVADDVTITKQDIEIADTAWLPVDEAVDRLTYDNLKNLLKRAHQYITMKIAAGN
ncbi:bis(5'-nucleosyl)-tetraphosphatase [Secundilactobacillus collinoides]|uniref:Bis(5'-nucleosyl)-tetraphosphatase [asymmetrical] n=2 Tax=Secundilactobacillus collinoides TaxID=33960 RepID=A0A0R2BJQ8_SECCO|nr:NUDIX domain-containing protein [Secundilactobacillus collinoides]KRM78004.1 hydrolase, NUDIX family [Secundilactobacillus collinoides DSM 20515 = JCM 1123]KZL40064.1 NUDIX hydrolase [Secundilactobacillus collinoides]